MLNYIANIHRLTNANPVPEWGINACKTSILPNEEYYKSINEKDIEEKARYSEGNISVTDVWS